MGGDEANITKKLLWGTSKWLATPCDGRNIAIPPKKAQYDLIDNNSNGKSRLRGGFTCYDEPVFKRGQRNELTGERKPA